MLTVRERHLLVGNLANAATNRHHRSEEVSALAKWVADGENRTTFASKRKRNHRRRLKLDDEGGGGSARKLRHLQQELQDECLATKRARCSRTARSLRSLVTVTGMTLTDVRILELMVRYFRCLPRNVSLRPRVLCPLFPARSSRWT